jgi:hypothetical protein
MIMHLEYGVCIMIGLADDVAPPASTPQRQQAACQRRHTSARKVKAKAKAKKDGSDEALDTLLAYVRTGT